MADGLAQVEGAARSLVPRGSWICASDLAARPADPLMRAACAWTGLGTWPRRDGQFYVTDVDAQGRPLDGRRPYVITFPPGAAPPARAFWSLTVHPGKATLPGQCRGRLAIGDRDPLWYEPDGTLTILLQTDPPEGAWRNWMPTPEGPFGLALRLYWPQPAALDGSWRPPRSGPAPEQGAPGGHRRCGGVDADVRRRGGVPPRRSLTGTWRLWHRRCSVTSARIRGSSPSS